MKHGMTFQYSHIFNVSSTAFALDVDITKVNINGLKLTTFQRICEDMFIYCKTSSTMLQFSRTEDFFATFDTAKNVFVDQE